MGQYWNNKYSGYRGSRKNWKWQKDSKHIERNNNRKLPKPRKGYKYTGVRSPKVSSHVQWDILNEVVTSDKR